MHSSLVADLYILLFDKIDSHKPLAHEREGFYLGENGEYDMYDLPKTISEALHSKGKSKSVILTIFSEDEIEQYFSGGTMSGTNFLCKAERSRAIGWQLRKGYREFLSSVDEEIPN